ncbi:MAG: hypothetical protein ACD_57C00141G0002 [uncultured bacterium]|uniref:Uncharacterized protein n=1 Tax=Candidatus Curtissbacteria bacterium RIFOXYA1_FULL_41_14 TaxID=1797737 RepID=A0A1F5HGF2_9BACT|nr:MAG: hypothetical protein ACD_57C00141G0002 [uncultured bacterium]KKR56955.1 MAG: hypothetical protein UT95_C0030G0002 [Candidatus Curtissbacteria bacterium GW2011_GWB1_40_28]KKR61098.1 MAG: hypothetical protein UT99_C0002G0027 [Candidatus Curtissbacteria bacterium GW2011_GWA2_40_31]KKR61978.1 MAG: hypothetical protein UU00_C0005G0034 [Microgenomates group bacterium GW2011_GWC1_40_35]KKR66088.1 MAG: hypothetical protein UU05_C0005G0008 [Candidatus Curtissbacteria bacterium GW2011_GWA1_40_47]
MEPKEKKGTRIVIGPQELTPEEQRIRDATTGAIEQLRSDLEKSQALAEFMANYRALRALCRADLSWMQPNEITTESLIVSFRSQTEAIEDAKIASELLPVIQSTSGQPDQIKMTLKRIRDKRGYYTYAVLAQFPKGKFAEDPVFGHMDRQPDETDIIYFRPTSPCVLHTCDDLFKIHRNNGFHIPFKTRNEAVALLEQTPEGLNEYVVSRTEEGRVKQEAGNFILVALHGAYSNEINVVRVSKFLSRQTGAEPSTRN